MKISDLLASLAGSAKDLEAQMDEWNKSLSVQGDQALAKVKEWQKTAERRSEEWRTQFNAYANDVDMSLKNQWTELQAGFEKQMVAARKQAEAWRAEADKKDANTKANWYEAYAANMISVARRAEQEAAAAISAAAEARAKAPK
ncbi:MAG: hypothetical protein LZF86_220025 [Nitrospira sp.]|nr:MAG: hypothetical protein LZF86_220025 [Nitrospira sp.]